MNKQDAATIDWLSDAGQAQFRSALSCFATGITVVTARTADGTAVGMAANSFSSVSLEPPLVSLAVARASATWERMKQSPGFAVSVLAAGHADVARNFSRKGIDRFSGVACRESPAGRPVIEGALAWFDCTFRACHEAGDHDVIIGQVRHLGMHAGQLQPLVFFRSVMQQLS